MGGYSETSDLDLGKKVGNLDFWDGGGYSGNVMEKKTYFTEKLTFPSPPFPVDFPISAECKLDIGTAKPKSCPKLQIQQMLEMDLLLITSNSETIPEPGMVSTVYFFAKYTLIIFPSKFT